MKTINQQDREITHSVFEVGTISKRTLWNRKRNHSYLTQYKLNH